MCPDSFVFRSVPEGVTVSIRCSNLSPYLYGGTIYAKCGAYGVWEGMDLSQCTFKNTPIDYIFIIGSIESTNFGTIPVSYIYYSIYMVFCNLHCKYVCVYVVFAAKYTKWIILQSICI